MVLALASGVYVMTDFGQYLRKLRKAKGMSIRQLALKARVSNPYLSQLEKGKRSRPSPEILARLASCLGVTYGELMKAAGYPTEDVPLSDRAVIEKRNEKGEVVEVRVATEAAHRTDGYEDELPEEAKKALEEYKEFLRQKYKKK